MTEIDPALIYEAYQETTFLPAADVEMMTRLGTVRHYLAKYPPSDDPGVYILVIEPSQEPRWYKVDQEKSSDFTLGRAESCDVPLGGTGVSKVHCLLSPEPEGWAVVDCESRNGIKVNDQIVKRQAMRDGDVVQFGTVSFIFITVFE